MNWNTYYIVLCFAYMTAGAMARMGDSPAECQRRYGASITNFPGYQTVAGALTYQLQDVAITAVFTTETGGGPLVSMIIYSRITPLDEIRSIRTPIAPEEQASILASVPGRWESYEEKVGLAGKPSNVISISSQPSPVEQRRDKVEVAIQKTLDVVYLGKQHKSRKRMTHIAYNGADRFAIEVMQGVAIGSFSTAKAIEAWATQIQLEGHLLPTEPPLNF